MKVLLAFVGKSITCGDYCKMLSKCSFLEVADYFTLRNPLDLESLEIRGTVVNKNQTSIAHLLLHQRSFKASLGDSCIIDSVTIICVC
jgi:hypothetical protein